MRYRNAGDLLPEALVKELQRYVQGEYLYIPTDGTQRKGWGERSGARQMLDARNRAIRHLEKGRVIILACGTGNPFFSTDTASALRAAEINADIIFKATMVDGVYDKDPKKYADAKKYDTLTFSRVLADQLAVMDSTAATMCRDNSLPILVFDILHPENIAKAVAGEPIGTLVVEQ